MKSIKYVTLVAGMVLLVGCGDNEPTKAAETAGVAETAQKESVSNEE